jgi:phenylalanyl-tRNA synthetase beta chain
MKISINLINHYGGGPNPLDNGLDNLLKLLGSRLGAVEEVIHTASLWEGAVVAKVISCEKHPNADKLSVCMVDDGAVFQDIERDSNGLVQVVCGAPNVTAGQLVVWLPPGCIVPSSHNDKEPFILGSRELRGVISNGMIASASELALGNDHSGILVLDKSNDVDEIKPGSPFNQLFDLDDTIIDLENKMFTHRPDCFGILGVARELSGIAGHQYKSPQWYLDPKHNLPIGDELPLAVSNENTDLIPRFLVQVIKDITIKPSPLWLQATLAKLGIKSINNLVDLTNYYMVLTGQPLHAFDYDKLVAHSNNPSIGPRLAKEGEEITLLGNKKIKLTSSDIVIATDSQAVALAGVMGGVDTEVDDGTKNIVLECATFDMYSIRRTSMRHGLFTDAVTRFTKGQSPLQNDAVLAKIIADILEMAGGRVASKPLDLSAPRVTSKTVKITAKFINDRLGSNLDTDTIIKLLSNVEFNISSSGPDIDVTPPFWRQDIHIKEDIVEEVGRLYGYDNLSVNLPVRQINPVAQDKLRMIKSGIREILKNLGANEVLTYSFVHQNLLDSANQDTNDSYKLSNALSPALQYYRQSLTPSLLEKVHPNIKSGFDNFALYEIGKGHSKTQLLDSENLPHQQELLAFVYASKENLKGAAYYYARMYLDELAKKLNIKLSYKPVDDSQDSPIFKPFKKSRSATVSVGDIKIGVIGEYQPNTLKALKLPYYCAGFEIDIAKLLSVRQGLVYNPISKYPSVTQDISLKAPSTIEYSDINGALLSLLDKNISKNTLYTFEPIDFYQDSPDFKHFTFRLKISSYDTTLKSEQVNSLLDTAADSIKKSHNCTRI